ncbi:MAG: vitamin B12-dependent ribonucleotide reductase [Bacillota bacterium]|nr:vitamin B12-dependent ribonucleotide reductase [Bacillota bacterium]
MGFSENAIRVLEKRYLAKDENGNLIEGVEDLFRRVAKHIAQPDKKYDAGADTAALEEQFYEAMTSQKFMPNSPTLMNAGRPLGQLSACFVLPVEDNMEGIFNALKNAALIHKSGGGTGFSFSRLRPKGASVCSTGGVASGPVSFMKVFNAATEAVKQGGTRRGANMGILRVDHPDILEFIQCKQDNADITNFNISVGLTEAFMSAVEKNGEYELIDPHTKKVVKMQNAREVYDLIIEMAWINGEPGIIYLDRLNKDNVVPSLGEIESTNPCGEQPLLPFESCNLGSINLDRMVAFKNGKHELDYQELGRTVDLAVHFLDNVIDVNVYPLPEIEEMTKKTRKIGLGVMGFADMLFKLGIPYNSEAGTNMAEKVMAFIQKRSHAASAELAKARGPFPFYPESTLKDSGTPIRNATTTTIAPTGTISIICGASSGIEPLFAISFVRNVMDNDQLTEVYPHFEQMAKEKGFYSPGLMRRIAEEGTLAHIEEIPQDIRKVYVCAHDISPEYHIKMQAAFQKYTDNAVSKTVNFSREATRENVREVYNLAHLLGCKGITIYRDGSREGQVLNVGMQKEEKPAAGTPQISAGPQNIVPRPRPEITRGFTEKVVIGCGNLYITVNYDADGICEIFTNLGKAGGCPSQSEATSRLVSLALRSGIDVNTLIWQLKGIRCHSTVRQKNLKVLSCPDAIGRVIEKVTMLNREENGNGENNKLADIDIANISSDPEGCLLNCSLCPHRDNCDRPFRKNMELFEGLKPINGGEEQIDIDALLSINGGKCPDCGKVLERESGCVVCRACGYSKCG